MASQVGFLEALKIWCQVVGVDYLTTSEEILKLLGKEPVIDFVTTLGPTPEFPDNLAELYVLGRNVLFDYEVRKQVRLRTAIPLIKIDGVVEQFVNAGSEQFLSEYFIYGVGQNNLTVRYDKAESVRRFANSVIARLAEIGEKNG